jgi:nitroimidazol reductase NimA-like FMN-containing flavoprotein (pyridoxamine 5'-phosphate oxidase superfamily)
VPLTPVELDAFLAEIRLCHFATVDDKGRPRVRPLWYLWRDGAFWLTTRMEIRHTGRDLGSQKIATLSIASDDKPYRAVIATGEVEVLGRDEALLKAVSSRYGDEGRWLAHAMTEPDRVAMKLAPKTLLSWHYGRGDNAKQNEGVSMRTPVS